jgi:hypothetical protein
MSFFHWYSRITAIVFRMRKITMKETFQYISKGGGSRSPPNFIKQTAERTIIKAIEAKRVAKSSCLLEEPQQ